MSYRIRPLPPLNKQPVLSRAQKAYLAQRLREDAGKRRDRIREERGHLIGLYGSPASRRLS